MAEHFDVLIIGAGLSGIGAACHLTMKLPGKSFALLEARDTLGGTWDLFRYPGIRSDSDMHTLGYSFRPWEQAKAIADGPAILNYVRETAAAYGVDRKIRFGHRVKSVSWSTADAAWTVEAEHGPQNEPVRLTCGFLIACAGYYDYAGGHAPEFAGSAEFAGRIVHPQHWPEDLDVAGKRVVVIGSGATAVTLVPKLAETAAHVTMLQRSPTYIASRPSEDALANTLRRRLPAKLAYRLIRWRNVAMTLFFVRLARRKPAKFAQMLIGGVSAYLGKDYDVATHFTPAYDPWTQRLCLAPDGDFFHAIRKGAAEIVTDQVDTFTPGGLRLRSGAEVAADVVVTATGLKMLLLGGVKVAVDGVAADLSKAMSYKGSMFSGVPNLAAVFGYTNASWTLKADLTCEYVCRVLKHMDRRGYAQCLPAKDPAVAELPFLNLTSGYVQRAAALLPRQGAKGPWRTPQHYPRDLVALRFGKVDDGTLRFTRQPVAVAKVAEPA